MNGSMAFDSRWPRFCAAAALLLALWPRPAGAQDRAPAEASEIDKAVAQALLSRANELAARGDYQNAKMLVVESLERSEEGPHAADALVLLRSVNRALGLSELDRTVPGARDGGTRDRQLDSPDGAGASGSPGMGDVPLDPYGAPAGRDEPLDPYGEPAFGAGGRDEPLDPYAEPEGGGAGALGAPADKKAGDARDARRVLLLYGGLYGFTAGMALAGPNNEFGDLRDGAATIGILGGAAGVGLAHLVSRKYSLTSSQAGIVGWSGIWGGVAAGVLTDLVTGIETTSTNEMYKGVALGGLLGTGAGVFLARTIEPSVGDIALANSLGMYGTMSGVLLGIAMDPTESEGYSINALVGAAAGLGAGVFAARRLETSRRRMFWVDMGAAAGALVPWVLVYPAIDGDGSTPARVTGVISSLGMIGGALIAWRVTAGMDGDEPADDVQSAAVPGLFQRHENGRWTAGMLAVRPVQSLSMSGLWGAPAGRGFFVDVLGGRF